MVIRVKIKPQLYHQNITKQKRTPNPLILNRLSKAQTKQPKKHQKSHGQPPRDPRTVLSFRPAPQDFAATHPGAGRCSLLLLLLLLAGMGRDLSCYRCCVPWRGRGVFPQMGCKAPAETGATAKLRDTAPLGTTAATPHAETRRAAVPWTPRTPRSRRHRPAPGTGRLPQLDRAASSGRRYLLRPPANTGRARRCRPAPAALPSSPAIARSLSPRRTARTGTPWGCSAAPPPPPLTTH